MANACTEVANVGAVIGGGFENTAKLKPVKYKAAINGPNGEARKVEINHKHKRMKNHEVFEVVDCDNMPPGTKLVDRTWIYKKKSNNPVRATKYLKV